ncbi:MAG: phospholipase D-like domain-containing protein [Blastocatellia bacterium]
MTPEDVARRYARRPGYKLVGFAEVVLPVYRLTLQVITLDRKKIPPIEEFILKSIDAGLHTIREIGSLLGIKDSVVRGGLINLLRSEDISQKSGSPVYTFRLTPKGENTLRDAEIITPEEHTVQIYFDALLHRPAAYHKDTFYSSKQVKSLGLIEVPVESPIKPQLSDLPRQEVSKIIQQTARIKDYRAELLAVKSIEKSVRLGRYSIALVYKSKQSDEINVAFAVDGRLVNELEAAFARQNGPKRMGVERLINYEVTEKILQELPEEILNEMPPEEVMDSLEEKEVSAQAKVEAARLDLERAITAEAKVEAQKHLTEATERLSEVQAGIDQLTIRFLNVYDHPRLLQKALDECTERLMIVSPWITASVVDAEFLKKLETALQRGVNVYIAHGLGEKGKHYKGNESLRTEERLKELASRHKNFRLKFLGNTHAKVLLYDSKCVALSSFNWLSFKGDPDKTFRDEQGVLITRPDLIDEKFNDQLKYFDQATI